MCPTMGRSLCLPAAIKPQDLQFPQNVETAYLQPLVVVAGLAVFPVETAYLRSRKWPQDLQFFTSRVQ